jgi:hypothetical protein
VYATLLLGGLFLSSCKKLESSNGPVETSLQQRMMNNLEEETLFKFLGTDYYLRFSEENQTIDEGKIIDSGFPQYCEVEQNGDSVFVYGKA